MISNSEIFDVIIIGAGPAGLTAGIYAKRAELSVLLIERYAPGGQILSTYEIDNYPGMPGLSGSQLGAAMLEHMNKFDVPILETEVNSMELLGEVKRIHTDDGVYLAKTVILASGNSPRKLDIPGEEELLGCGVSYCATCDGAFFKSREVAVIGGGDVAVEDAIFLARGCKKVYVIHRRNELRAAKVLQSALFALDNVEMIWDSVCESINGEDQVESLSLRNVVNDETTVLPVSGVFVATGNTPNTSFADGGQIKRDAAGYIVAGEDCITSIPGVYAAGDVRTKKLRQVSTAVGDGANAVYSALEYLSK